MIRLEVNGGNVELKMEGKAKELVAEMMVGFEGMYNSLSEHDITQPLKPMILMGLGRIVLEPKGEPCERDESKVEIKKE